MNAPLDKKEFELFLTTKLGLFFRLPQKLQSIG
jgi:hypothetical protein